MVLPHDCSTWAGLIASVAVARLLATYDIYIMSYSLPSILYIPSYLTSCCADTAPGKVSSNPNPKLPLTTYDNMYTPQPQRFTNLPLSPPPSGKSSMDRNNGAWGPTGAVASPPPQDMVLHQGRVLSPEQIPPQPTYSPSVSERMEQSLDFDDPATRRRLTFALQQQELQRHHHQQQQQQQYTQPPPQQIHNGFPQPTQQVPLPNTSGLRHQTRDSGYGSYDTYDRTYGQSFAGYQQMPFPPQQAQPIIGNKYGKIRAKGNSKVLMANVVDKNTNPYMLRQQQYEDAEFDENADAMLDDVTVEGMQAFFARPQR